MDNTEHHEGAASAVYLRLLERTAERLGIDVGPMLEKVGIDEAAAASNDAWFDRAQIYTLWDLLAEATNDEALGLHVAEAEAHVPSAGVLEYSARNCANLEGAYIRVERFSRLVLDGSAYSFLLEDARGGVRYKVPGNRYHPCRHAADWFMAGLLLKGREFTGVNFSPLEVWLDVEAPASTAEHERLFGCPVIFEAEESGIFFSREVLALPMTAADPALGAVLDRFAEEQLAKIPHSQNATDRVRHFLTRALSSGGDPSLNAIARDLAMSPRTLQRRLKDEGSTHRELVEDARRSLALEYVNDPELSVGEMAFLLGFSEPSAFLRAFKRWTGSSPGRIRAEAAGSGARA